MDLLPPYPVPDCWSHGRYACIGEFAAREPLQFIIILLGVWLIVQMLSKVHRWLDAEGHGVWKFLVYFFGFVALLPVFFILAFFVALFLRDFYN